MSFPVLSLAQLPLYYPLFVANKQTRATDWSGDKDHYVRKGVRAFLHGAFFTRGIWGFGVAQGEVPPVQDSAPARGNEKSV